MTEIISESIVGAAVAAASSALTWAFTTSRRTAVMASRLNRGEKDTSKQWDRLEEHDRSIAQVCGFMKELQANQAAMVRMQDEMLASFRDLRDETLTSIRELRSEIVSARR